jgi:hypothetical protein
MAPSTVDPNKKPAKSSIDQLEEDPFYIDGMARSVSCPSQATVHLAKRTPQEIINVLMREKHIEFQLQICYIR